MTIVRIAIVAALLAGPGCTRVTTYVVDTTQTKGFHWDGTVRLTERHTPGFLFEAPRTTYDVELPGEGSRRVVITPGDPGPARYPNAELVGGPADDLIPLMMGSMVGAAMNAGGAAERRRLPVSVAETNMFARPASAPSVDAADEFDHRRFDRITALQALEVAASRAQRVTTTCQLARGNTLRAEIEPGPERHVLVTILDASGGVIHRFPSVTLPILVKESTP